jgi:hypothetical protein
LEISRQKYFFISEISKTLILNISSCVFEWLKVALAFQKALCLRDWQKLGIWAAKGQPEFIFCFVPNNIQI